LLERAYPEPNYKQMAAGEFLLSKLGKQWRIMYIKYRSRTPLGFLSSEDYRDNDHARQVDLVSARALEKGRPPLRIRSIGERQVLCEGSAL
jgi:hypothetical protein